MAPDNSLTTNYHLPPTAPPLVVIVGPTASGKTALAISVAKKVGGEIICADSRTIYKGMNIGTAKPTLEEQDGIAHFGLDLIKPGDRFTAADFQHYAKSKIKAIRQRGHVPILVGGSGLYVDSVIYDYQFPKDCDAKQRKLLQKMTIEELQELCSKNNISLPLNLLNKRHLIRTIEVGGINNKKSSHILENTIIVGITVEKEILRERIEKRAGDMFDKGVVEEATQLAKVYGSGSEAMTASIYRILNQMLAGQLTEAEAIRKFVLADLHLAKRQMTWFRRNSHIKWSEDKDFLESYCISSVT